MRILVTNDDGIDSPGLFALKRALDPLGEVTVIAPDSNRSATGRSITIRRPLHVEERTLADGSPGLATDGTPVDCVRFALLGLMDGAIPDVIVSGINLGLNLGDDVTYSGTVAAAFEGVLLGWPAIAVSQGALDGNHWHRGESEYDFGVVAEFVAALVPHVVAEGFPPGLALNVNAPGIPSAEVTGVRVTRLGRRIYHDSLQLLEGSEPDRRRYLIYGDDPSHHPEDGTDFAAIEDGAISVTPMHFELTDVTGMATLSALGLDGMFRRVSGRAE